MTRQIISILLIVFTALTVLLAASCSNKQPSCEKPSLATNDYRIESAICYENLAVFPVVSSNITKLPDYLTLKEAQDNKQIEISECESENVPLLKFRNKSDRFVMLLAGEVVCGGKQDRVIQHDLIIPPKIEMEIEVRCVEHGRWGGKSAEFRYSGKMSNNSVRMSAQYSDQSEVWRNVERDINRLDLSGNTQSSSYKAIISSKEINDKASKCVSAISSSLKHLDNVVGIVVAINGEIVSCDIFGNDILFAKYAPQLLESLAVQALCDKDQKPSGVPTVANAAKFLDNALKGETKLTELDNNFSLAGTRNNKQVSIEIRSMKRSVHFNSYRIDKLNKQPESNNDQSSNRQYEGNRLPNEDD